MPHVHFKLHKIVMYSMKEIIFIMKLAENYI